MKEQKKEKLIGLKEAAERLGIHEDSIRKGLLGTKGLSRIRPGGGKRILLVESEVDILVEEWIKRARAQTAASAVQRNLRII